MTDAKPSKLDRLLDKQRQLAQEIAAINAREKASERKDDTRRKILIGSAALVAQQRGDFTEKQLIALLDGFLVHPRDRVLFPFLPPRLDNAKEEQAASSAPASDPSLAPTPPVADTSPKLLPTDRTFRHNPIYRKEDLL